MSLMLIVGFKISKAASEIAYLVRTRLNPVRTARPVKQYVTESVVTTKPQTYYVRHLANVI